MTKTCIKCGHSEPTVTFFKSLKNRKPHCKNCEKERMRLYRAQDRLLALQAYGGKHPKCSCPGCQESNIEFLSIDHIDGGGREQRRTLRQAQKHTKPSKWNKDSDTNPGGGVFFRWLRKNNYPTGYRVLCHNCNTGRKNGPCPVHEIKGIRTPTISDLRKDILRKLVAGVKSGRIVLS
jgi:hypothetical protein